LTLVDAVEIGVLGCGIGVKRNGLVVSDDEEDEDDDVEAD
jgi:hypothetical protein